MDAMMKPNLLSPDDAVNLLVVVQELMQEDMRETSLDEVANGLADLLVRNAAAVRFATNTTPLPPPSASQLIERATGRNGDLTRAVSFVIRARRQLVATPEVDFATLQAVDFLLGVAEMVLLITDLDQDLVELDVDLVEVAPDFTDILRFTRELAPAGDSVH